MSFFYLMARLQNLWRRIEEQAQLFRQYSKLRLRILFLPWAVRYPWLRRCLRQVGAAQVKPKPGNCHFLWRTTWTCPSCSDAYQEPISYPLGDCNLVPIQESNGWTKTVIVSCPVCSCTSQRGYRLFFNFELGTWGDA